MQDGFNWLFLDLNSFFASCEQQAQPHLRSRPVGIVPMLKDSTCCIAASYEAKRHGVKTGTGVAEARSLCPDIVFVQARPRVYVEYHHKVKEAIGRHLPIEQVLSIDEMACRLMGSEREPHNAVALARRIKHEVIQHAGECLTSSVGLAPNRFLAKVASDMEKPDGLTTLLLTDLPHKLHTLKLTDIIGIGPRMKQRLYRHGVFDVQTLCALDSMRMRQIWGGVTGLRFYTDLHGQDWDYKPTHTSSMSHQHVLEPHLRTVRGAREVTQRLLSKGAERMRKSGYYARRLSLVVKLAHDAGYFENACSFVETQDTAELLKRLEELWGTFPRGIPWRVGVVLGGLVAGSAHQLDLFAAPPQNGKLLEAIDEVNRRYGRDTLTFGLSHAATRTVGKDKISFQRVPERYEVGVA